MSDTTNSNYIESLYENFQQAVSDGDFSLVQRIIAEVKEQGFKDAAERMEEDLANIPVGKTE